MNRRVLVVGAGPVGLTLALQLRQFGVQADLIERGTNSNSYSKALSLNAASLKAFHGLGLRDQIAREGKAISDIYLYARGRRFAHIDKKRLGGLYDYYLSLPQPRTEDVLKEGFAAAGGLLHYENELVDMRQTVADVEVVIRDHRTNLAQRARYDAVVGCDGAHSTVRELTGIGFSGKNYEFHFLMGDVCFGAGPLQSHTTYHIGDDGFLIFLPMENGLTRLVIGKRQPLPANRPKPEIEELQRYLDHYHSQGYAISSLVWSSSAPIFTRLAETPQAGNVFLAGDAFRLFSPIGGQGMNTGIQDAVNLGWKLAYRLRGLCSKRLLGTYGEERCAAVRKIEKCTSEHTEAIFGIGGESVAAFYRPAMANRTNLRTMIAQQFSGLAFDHSREGELIGKHVPYVPFDSTTLGCGSTYDLPRVGKNAVFLGGARVAGSSQAAESPRSTLVAQDYSLCSEGLEHVASGLGMRDEEVCVVRPDGFVGFQGSPSDCGQYFATYYPTFSAPVRKMTVNTVF